MPVSHSVGRNVTYDVVISVVSGGLVALASAAISGSGRGITGVDLLSGSIAVLLIGAVLVLLTVPTSRDFVLDSIPGPGNSIFYEEDAGGLGNWPQEFWVKLTFDFRSRYAFTITQLDVQYMVEADGMHPTPREIYVEIDGDEIETDGNYELSEHVELKGGEPKRFLLSRDFQRWDPPRATDYGSVEITVRGSSPAWRSFKTVRVAGELDPGGEFTVQEVTLEDGTLTRMAETMRDSIERLRRAVLHRGESPRN